ncbi:unnamed protein product [Mytilus edulis]|uniref:Uncharacterized protein n=1 Tax=Mytilus edulis TaxID=6550 RepID=A0A8S3QLM0_MYTED|nr:unnamed protein product [Mytilus edulis]
MHLARKIIKKKNEIIKALEDEENSGKVFDFILTLHAKMKYGINSGVYLAPVGCKVIADGCDPIFVLQSDETRDCKTGKKIDLTLKPEIIQPSFPGVFPSNNMFPNTRLPDLRDMLRKGMNYQYNYHTSGRNITVCTLSNGLEILNGSTVNLASCETCSCGEKELSCCGVGALAGVGPTPPKHCKTIRDGCEDIMVLKADETRDCFTGKSILLPSHPLYSLQNMYDMAQQQYMATNNMNQGTQMANIAPQQFSGSNAGTGHMIAGNMIRANYSKVDARIAPQMTSGKARQMTAGRAQQMAAGMARQKAGISK